MNFVPFGAAPHPAGGGGGERNKMVPLGEPFKWPNKKSPAKPGRAKKTTTNLKSEITNLKYPEM